MGKRILVVDNHPIILKFMTNLLKKEGHEVLTAVDGLSALQTLKSGIPDVMFVDLIMPNIGGEKLCRIVRSKPELNDIYIIILSGIAAEQVVDFVQFGANACIAKSQFDKMGKNVLSVLEQMDPSAPFSLSNEILGLDGLFPAEVTKELLYSQRHSELILGNMAEGILELTLEGNVIYANSVSISLIGIPEEKLLAFNFTELFVDEHRQRVRDLLRGINNGPQKVTEDSPVRLNDKDLTLTLLLVKDEGHQSVIVIINDVSEQKRLENRLQHAQKMEAIATLAGGIAHEFNNALFSISGNIEILQINLPDQKIITEHVKPLYSSIDRMVNLTNQLLAYAHGGKFRSPEKIALPTFVNDTLSLINRTIHPTIRVNVDLSNNIHQVYGDPTQMQMVLSAIISNAAEAIKEAGDIRVSARNMEIDNEFDKIDPDMKPGPYVCLTIEDDGKGMDEQTRNRIFDPFFSTKFQGRGLGMAAVYGIIRKYDGLIAISSEIGEGTCVNIYLPASVEQAVARH